MRRKPFFKLNDDSVDIRKKKYCKPVVGYCFGVAQGVLMISLPRIVILGISVMPHELLALVCCMNLYNDGSYNALWNLLKINFSAKQQHRRGR